MRINTAIIFCIFRRGWGGGGATACCVNALNLKSPSKQTKSCVDMPLILLRGYHMCQWSCVSWCRLFCRSGCRSLSGTSVASPVVAGAVTLLLRSVSLLSVLSIVVEGLCLLSVLLVCLWLNVSVVWDCLQFAISLVWDCGTVYDFDSCRSLCLSVFRCPCLSGNLGLSVLLILSVLCVCLWLTVCLDSGVVKGALCVWLWLLAFEVVPMLVWLTVITMAQSHPFSLATCEDCFTHQLITSLLSGMSRAVHPQESSKADVEHCHMPVWASHSTFHPFVAGSFTDCVRRMACVVWLVTSQGCPARERAWLLPFPSPSWSKA